MKHYRIVWFTKVYWWGLIFVAGLININGCSVKCRAAASLLMMFFTYFLVGSLPPKSSNIMSFGDTPKESNNPTTALLIGPGPHI